MATSLDPNTRGTVQYVSDDGTQAIFPLPDSIVFSTDYNWETVDTGIVGSVVGKFKEGKIEDTASWGFAKEVMMRIGVQPDSVAGEAGEIYGHVLNPKTEILFKGVRQREFTFKFSIAYKSQLKMASFFHDLNQLYYSAAPDTDNSGVFFTAPKIGQLTIVAPDGKNIVMPRIVAIKRITTDLTPDGVYASYTNGYPLHVSIEIAFVEMIPPSKQSDKEIFFTS